MAEMPDQIEIPDRALFKAAEVCELLKVQPYVLRTWEAEFRDLGVAKGASGARVYRREDIERVQRIKHLLLIEGLTLAGVRRKLEEESEPPLEMEAVVPAVLASTARERIGSVKQGLRSLLDLLAAPVLLRTATASGDEFALASPADDEVPEAARASRSGGSSKGASPRRKRSA